MPIRAKQLLTQGGLRGLVTRNHRVFLPTPAIDNILNTPQVMTTAPGAWDFDGDQVCTVFDDVYTPGQKVNLGLPTRLRFAWSATGTVDFVISGVNQIGEKISQKVNKLNGPLITRTLQVFARIDRFEITGSENPANTVTIGSDIPTVHVFPMPYACERIVRSNGIVSTDDFVGVVPLNLGGAVYDVGAPAMVIGQPIQAILLPNVDSRTISVATPGFGGAGNAPTSFTEWAIVSSHDALQFRDMPFS